jgi:hypothetical protein
LLVICLATIVIAHGQDNQQREIAGKRLSISEIRDYRTMFRVNQQPVDMVEQTKMMCAPPSLTYGPHYDPGVVYYINDVARQGLNSFRDKKLFPIGTIIVKEKQETRTESSVQIITVMKKVQPGDSEDSWDYKMYDTRKWVEVDPSIHSATPVRRTCLECHRRYRANDYVSDKGIQLLLGR